jgi:hypothetical protein
MYAGFPRSRPQRGGDRGFSPRFLIECLALAIRARPQRECGGEHRQVRNKCRVKGGCLLGRIDQQLTSIVHSKSSGPQAFGQCRYIDVFFSADLVRLRQNRPGHNTRRVTEVG